MPRYKVTMPAVLVFEVDAPNPVSAGGAIWSAFRAKRANDALQGTRFNLDATERQCGNAQLMTTSATDIAHGALEVEEA